MLCGANGRIEKAGSRLIRILLSRQYTTTLTKLRDQIEEQGKKELQFAIYSVNLLLK
jgi:hypothetical protein